MLKLDETRLFEDIKRKCNYELDKVSGMLIEFMVFEISQIPNETPYAVGKPEWRLDVIEALRYVAKVQGMSLIRDVGLINPKENDLMKAMIIEFGMGNKADLNNNPWISEYLSGDKYNRERHGMDVLGRKGMEVYDIDDNAYYESTATHNKEIKHFAQEGSEFWRKVFGNSSTLASGHFATAMANINAYVNNIDICKYITRT